MTARPARAQRADRPRMREIVAWHRRIPAGRRLHGPAMLRCPSSYPHQHETQHPVTASASQVYDAIDFSQADDGIRRIGVFLAWAVNHRLLSERLEREAASAVARVRFRDLSGSEMLTTVCHGELARHHLSDAGNQFAERWYNDGYLPAYARAVVEEKSTGASHDATHSLDGEWALYDRLAPEITHAHRGPTRPEPTSPPPQKPKRSVPWLKVVK